MTIFLLSESVNRVKRRGACFARRVISELCRGRKLSRRVDGVEEKGEETLPSGEETDVQLRLGSILANLQRIKQAVLTVRHVFA